MWEAPGVDILEWEFAKCKARFIVLKKCQDCISRKSCSESFFFSAETIKRIRSCINTDINTVTTVSLPSTNPSKTGGIRIVSSCAHP
jgi:hypothetical protein